MDKKTILDECYDCGDRNTIIANGEMFCFACHNYFVARRSNGKRN